MKRERSSFLIGPEGPWPCSVRSDSSCTQDMCRAVGQTSHILFVLHADTNHLQDAHWFFSTFDPKSKTLKNIAHMVAASTSKGPPLKSPSKTPPADRRGQNNQDIHHVTSS